MKSTSIARRRLRRLLLGLMLFGSVFTLVAWCVTERWMVNSDVEKAIARFGGTAVYDYKGSWLRHSRQMPEQLNDSWLTLQLRSIGGDRAFGNIRRVEFFAPPTPTPEVISTLGNLSSLHACLVQQRNGRQDFS